MILLFDHNLLALSSSVNSWSVQHDVVLCYKHVNLLLIGCLVFERKVTKLAKLQIMYVKCIGGFRVCRLELGMELGSGTLAVLGKDLGLLHWVVVTE